MQKVYKRTDTLFVPVAGYVLIAGCFRSAEHLPGKYIPAGGNYASPLTVPAPCDTVVLLS
jgi:hypothetical protein